MFETAEIGRKVSKQDFRKQERVLRTALLQAQRELRATDHNVIVLISGVEGAGKSAVVDRLHEWLDARGIATHAFWDESDEERQRPRFWRFWRRMPPRGQIGIMFGSWYTRPIIDHVYGHSDEAEYERQLNQIAFFEHMLSRDGSRLVKLWFHRAPDARQPKKVSKQKKFGNEPDLAHIDEQFAEHYQAFASASERAIRITDQGHAPWHIIEAGDARYRDLRAGEILLQALQAPESRQEETVLAAPELGGETVLDRVDLNQQLNRDSYRKQLKKLQKDLHDLSWEAYHQDVSLVALFEGWDAAGKGGAIRRATQAMDARLYRVISIAAPTDEERAQHYLWRFWRHLPRAGYTTIYDRSWYGRVLVERVENLARPDQWARAYREINAFEEQLQDAGTALAKFWLHISPEEQLERFRERETVAWKQHKLTEEDWRNREKWQAYATAVNDMVTHTSTANAPWTLIAGNDKKFARIAVLKTLCETLQQRLE